MKFLCTIYILIVVFAGKRKEKILVRCFAADLEEPELVYLSRNLNLLECLQLVKTIYDVTPAKAILDVRNHEEALNEDLSKLSPAAKECLVNLEQWNNDFPKNSKPGGRSTMEMTLRWLGRPDLAKYVRENRRSIKSLDTEDTDTLEFPGHRVSRRHAANNDKSAKGKKQKKKKKKRHHDEHSQHSAARSKGVHRAVAAATGHVATHKSHAMKKKENQSRKEKDYIEQHRSICCSIMFVLLFIVLCLVTVYFLQRRTQSKARGTRFKRHCNGTKEDKDTFTDYFEWDDDDVCSCSDAEAGCTGKCPMCSRNYQIREVRNQQSASDASAKHLNSVCAQTTKKRKQKRKRRFSFLQKSFQDRKKEKDQENRDRKKTLEKDAVKRHEKVSSIFQKDYPQCACCKCNLSSREKMLREKKENEKKVLYKLQKKKRKEEKRRRKEGLRKAEKRPNVCFKDTCK